MTAFYCHIWWILCALVPLLVCANWEGVDLPCFILLGKTEPELVLSADASQAPVGLEGQARAEEPSETAP